jgi:hypothetical protein
MRIELKPKPGGKVTARGETAKAATPAKDKPAPAAPMKIVPKTAKGSKATSR